MDDQKDRQSSTPGDIGARNVPRRSFIGTALYLVGATGLLGACGETVTSDTPDADFGDPFTNDSDTGDPVDSD